MSPPSTAVADRAAEAVSHEPVTAHQVLAVRDSVTATRSVPGRVQTSHLVFIVLAGLYLLPFMRIMLPLTNEGTLIYGAERILHGEVFARDFFEVMGPGTFYIVALFLKLFGASFLSTRIWLFASSLGAASCLYFLARRVCPGHALLPCLVVAGTSFGMQWPAISHHLDSNLFALLSVVLLVVWAERRHALLLYAVGLCACISAWIHQPKGTLVLLSMLAWLLISRLPMPGRVAACGRVLFGFAAVSLCAGAYFVSKGALAPLYYANVTWPAHNYGTVNKVPYALGIFSEYWHHWAALQNTEGSWPVVLATVLIVPFLFVALLPGILLISAPALRKQFVTPIVLLCWLSGAAVWLSEIHRPDIYHLVFGSPLLLLVGVRLLSNIGSRVVRTALQLLAISAFCLMTINLLQVVTAHSVSTRVGTVGMLQSDPILQFVDSHIPPGEETFFYPYCPMDYFLTGTKNPSRFSILVYNYNTPAEFEEVVHVLEQRRVRYVIWDESFQDRAKAVFPGIASVSGKAEVIEPYLESRYTQIAKLDRYKILMRKQ